MSAAGNVSVFQLAEGAVICDRNGPSVAGVALLERDHADGPGDRWRVRPLEALNRELGVAYRLPIDASAKLGGLSVVAEALERNDIAKAQVATLLMQFPDPPAFAKGVGSMEELTRLANALAKSGLLKGEDFEREHPRTGTPPNAGWFATKPKPQRPARPSASDPGSAWPSKETNQKVRQWAIEAFGKLMASGEERLIDGFPIADAIAVFIEGLGLGELNTGEQRILDQLYANFDPPKTLKQLQTPPTDSVLGYEQHHIVGQNPSNVAKHDSGFEEVLKKFGRDRIDDPDNIVWIPRLQHEKITSYYNSEDNDDPMARVRWKAIGDLDFAGQRTAGLAILRQLGVLQ
jgi:hypothetical protein